MCTRISIWTPNRWSRWLDNIGQAGNPKAAGRWRPFSWIREIQSMRKKGRTLTPTAKFLVFTLLALGAAATSAQTTEAAENSPVAQVRAKRSWEFAPFANYGNGIGGHRSNYHFFALGIEGGKVLTPTLHAGILSGQFQLAANIMPLWQAYTPAPHIQTFVYQGVTYEQPIGGGTYTGASIT